MSWDLDQAAWLPKLQPSAPWRESPLQRGCTKGSLPEGHRDAHRTGGGMCLLLSAHWQDCPVQLQGALPGAGAWLGGTATLMPPGVLSPSPAAPPPMSLSALSFLVAMMGTGTVQPLENHALLSKPRVQPHKAAKGTRGHLGAPLEQGSQGGPHLLRNV